MTSRILAAAFGATMGAALLQGGIAGAATLDTVKQRGQVLCGVNGSGLTGFAQPNDKGEWTGFDIDYCRAISAAVFGDDKKIKYVPLNAKDRFTALQSGEVDVLVRNSTWTLSRDTQLGLNFAAVNFYDGQGFMVRKSLKISSALELSGATICVQQGTSTELNLADYFRSHNLPYQNVTFATSDETRQAYDAGRCDSYTTDSSGLYAERLKLNNPDDHVILPDIISKEPLASVVRHGDDQWFDIVKWVEYAMVTAEESGVTMANVDDMAKSEKPDIKRLLGTEGTFGQMLGLDNKWAYNIVKLVGNYGESFERNVGQGSPLKIQRGINALWKDKGLQYAPPIL